LFAAGALTIAIAALSPLHVLGLTSFAAHMLEHELLMVVAAPLYAASRPLSAFLRALPEGVRFSLNNLGHTGVVSAIWRTISHPLFATLFHGLVLWVWHVPGLFEAALKLESVHRFQHVAFMGSALLFWWSLSPDGNWRRVNGSSIFYLFFTSLHSAILGMLLALTPRLWYQSYARDTGFGLAPIEDQQVAGLLMWVPTSLIYTACALVLTTLWVRRSAKSKLSYARP
jgi:cytochrome c oxidase assembly factor CtaG